MHAIVDIQYLVEMFKDIPWLRNILIGLALLWLVWQVRDPIWRMWCILKRALFSLRKKPFCFEYMGEHVCFPEGRGTNADDGIMPSGTKYMDAGVLAELAYIKKKFPRYKVDVYAVAFHPSAADPYQIQIIDGMQTRIYVGDMPPLCYRYDLYKLVKRNGTNERQVWFVSEPFFNGPIKDKHFDTYISRLSATRPKISVF